MSPMAPRRPASIFSRPSRRRVGLAALAFALVGLGLSLFWIAGERQPALLASPTAPTGGGGLADLGGLVPSPKPSRDPADVPPPGALSGAFLFFEDLEHTGDRWALAGASGGVGFHRLKAPACGGLYTLHVGRADHAPFTPLPLKTTATLKAPLDLTKAKRPLLRYDVKGEFSPIGALSLQPYVQVDGGAWQPLGKPALGRYPTVMTRFVLLTPYAGHKVRLRFEATMKAGTGKTKGYYLDDIYVMETGKS